MICIQQFGLDQITCYGSADAWLIFVKGRCNLLFEQGTVAIHNTCVLWLTLHKFNPQKRILIDTFADVRIRPKI